MKERSKNREAIVSLQRDNMESLLYKEYQCSVYECSNHRQWVMNVCTAGAPFITNYELGTMDIIFNYVDPYKASKCIITEETYTCEHGMRIGINQNV